jgi:hypothetical protein
MKNYFFGWTNIKWFIKEIGNLFSSKPSHFSKKRMESGIAFIIAQIGMLYFLFKNIGTMDTWDICFWAATEFAVSGYIITHIQREKKDYKESIEKDPSNISSEEEQSNS